MVTMVDAARLLLLTVFAIKAGEAASGKQLLPQNPLDPVQWQAVLTNYDWEVIAIIGGVLLFFLMLLIVIRRKRRRSYERIVYVPMPMQPPQK